MEFRSSGFSASITRLVDYRNRSAQPAMAERWSISPPVPDVIVLDISMPRRHSNSPPSRIRGVHPKSFKINASDLLVLTVSAISRNAYKWPRDHHFLHPRRRLRGPPTRAAG